MTTIQSPGAFCQLWKKCNQKQPFSNALRDYNFQFRDVKLCEVIALGSGYSGNKTIIGWVAKILERDKLKNRAETGKFPVFQGFEVKSRQFVPGW